MRFSQFAARFRPQKSNQTSSKSDSNKSPSPKKKKPVKKKLLEENNHLNTKNKLNKALSSVQKSIQSEGANGQLLLQKADILIRKNKFKQAQQILKEISQQKNDLKTSTAIKNLLEASEQLKFNAGEKDTKKLICKLNSITQKYNTKLFFFPKNNNLPPKSDIAQLIRKEARRARLSDLPNFARELIDQTLQAGHQSPWLLYDKALSLIMMGQRPNALSILNELKTASSTEEKLNSSVKKTIQFIRNNPEQNPIRLKKFLAKESTLISRGHNLQPTIPTIFEKSDSDINIKILILKQARSCLKTDPQLTLNLCASILDYIPNDSKSLQLKGEALAKLQRNKEAVKIWEDLNNTKNKKAAKRVLNLISQNLTDKAKAVCARKNPRIALFYYIKEKHKLKLVPTLNEGITEILLKFNPEIDDLADPELSKYQLQLRLNKLVLDYFEAQLRKHVHMNTSSKLQGPGAIRKTDLKAS